MVKKLTSYVPTQADKDVFKASVGLAGKHLEKALGAFLNKCGSHGIPASVAVAACSQWVMASLSRVTLVASNVPIDDISDEAIADLSLDLQESMSTATFEMMLKANRDKADRN